MISQKNQSKKKLQLKVSQDISLVSSVKVVLGMVMMLFLASSAIAGILTWYIFQ